MQNAQPQVRPKDAESAPVHRHGFVLLRRSASKWITQNAKKWGVCTQVCLPNLAIYGKNNSRKICAHPPVIKRTAKSRFLPSKYPD